MLKVCCQRPAALRKSKTKIWRSSKYNSAQHSMFLQHICIGIAS